MIGFQSVDATDDDHDDDDDGDDVDDDDDDDDGGKSILERKIILQLCSIIKSAQAVLLQLCLAPTSS